MRPIKFRIWFDGRMTVLGNMFVGIEEIGFSDKHYVDLNDYDHEKAVIMQFTGLVDKNDVPIYEGDIMQVPDRKLTSYDGKTHDYPYSVVEWDGLGWQPFVNADHVGEPELRDMSVAGNLYETPELLKSNLT